MPYTERAAWQSGRASEEEGINMNGGEGEPNTSHQAMSVLIDLLILQYIKLHFPHNVPFPGWALTTIKTNGNLGKVHGIILSLTTTSQSSQPVIELILLLFNCCAFINNHCYIIRGLVLLTVSPLKFVMLHQEVSGFSCVHPPSQVTLNSLKP